MEKRKNPAGKPASNLLFFWMVTMFFLALSVGIRLFGGGNAEAALSSASDTDMVENSTGTDAVKTSEIALSPGDIAEMDTEYAMSSYVNYSEAAAAVAAVIEKGAGNSVLHGGVRAASTHAADVLLCAAAAEDAGDLDNSDGGGEEIDTTTQNWFYYIYYVGQEDSYDITKTKDFSLKYQMEFRTSEDLSAGTVEIRIPAALVMYRDGTEVLPNDIAVPAGTPGDFTYSSKTPMNYYYETDGDDVTWLVFWNYRDITSGTDMAWQVLYRSLNTMNIVDMSTWELDSEIRVDVYRAGEMFEQTNVGATLTGVVNTGTTITSLTKGAYSISGKSYSPCLYTEKQVDKFIAYETPEYSTVMDKFDDYVYIVWVVTAKVSGNQPFTLEILEETGSDDGTDGVVIGYSQEMDSEGVSETGYLIQTEGNRSANYSATFYVVTAYSNDVVTDGTTVSNSVTAKLTPYDEIDDVQVKTVSADVFYRDYAWEYDGDLFRSDKTGNQTYEAYAEAYKYYYANGLDFGTFPFTSSVTARGYGLTHYIEWPEAGSYITGTYYIITLEDSAMDLNGTALTCEDYYFSDVTVTRTDHGYDIYEDETTAALDASDIDQDVTIFARFADQPEEWEIAGTIAYDETGGTKSYVFTQEQIDREPFAVKAVYNATNYDTVCKIEVDTVIKTESETMWNLVNGTNGNLILTDTSTATVSVAGSGAVYENVYEKTMSAGKTLTRLNGTNETAKTVAASNDAANARVQLTYRMAAYDGYMVYDAHTAAVLQILEVLSPSRNEVVFYDLLPYGIHFDASATPTAGRLTSLPSGSGGSIASKNYQSTAQVEISEVEIMENWNGTGRTMVAFHLTYSGADSSAISYEYEKGTLWYSGWGVSFQAYYDWKDMDVAAADGNDNIFAYMPESDAAVGTSGYRSDMRAFLGEAYADDGSIAAEDVTYAALAVSDLNGDGDSETKNVLYGKTSQSVSIALASTDYLTKLVRADANVSAAYAETASVEEGEGYTYDITVTTINGLTDLVIFDRLEYGLEDHTPDEELGGETESWKGTLVSVDTTGLKLAGAEDVIIWYNESSEAKIPEEKEKAEDVLTDQYGWYTADDWKAMGLTVADAGALAVDLGDFELEMAASVTFQIHMLAPEAGEVKKDVTYAFNNAYFSSYSIYTQTYGTVQGDTIRVSLGETSRLTVIKEYDGEVPSAYEKSEFEFLLNLAEQNLTFSQRIYTLWEVDENGDWQQVAGTYATDYNGYLYLYEGQKAVFENVTSEEMEEIRITETDSAFWKSETDISCETYKSGNTTEVICTVTNTFRTPLYVTKLTTAVPDDVDVSGYEFELTISVYNMVSGKWEPYADSTYWIVKAARTNGSEPAKISEGLSGADGTIRIHAGEVIAVFLPSEGTQYKVEETDTGTDFIVQTGTYSGTAALDGTAVNLTNIYRWKDLNLTKCITYQDASECTQEFTFQILHVLEDETAEPVSGHEWYLMDADGNVSDSGTLTENGEFTAACAGGTVTVRGLDAGEKYLIREADSGEFYEDITGSVSVTMPVYSMSKTAVYTNKWLMRDLSVTKYVAGDTDGASDGVKFAFALSVNGNAAEGYGYRITENGVTGDTVYYTGADGSFPLENGQTAVFCDCGLLGDAFEVYETYDGGFTRVYPSDDSALTGTFEEDGNQVTFVNGNSGSLMVAKIYTSDNSNAAAEYVSLIQTEGETRESAAVTFTMEITTDGKTYATWPTDPVTVEVIDTLNASSSTAIWTAEGITIEPWKFIVIDVDDIGEISGYRISESNENQYRILQDGDGNYLSITQLHPSGDAAYSGEIETSPVVTIVNKVSDITPSGSAFYKRMAVGSEEPAAGAELVLTVQQYSGEQDHAGGWTAAVGVAYLTFDEEGLTCDRVLYTDSSGKITLTKSENGYPYILFLEADVTLNLYDSGTADAGTYRILEDMDATDTEEWGLLVGYGTADNAYEYSLDARDVSSFVNSNRTAELKVEKVTDVSSGESFTFTLSHVLSTDENGNILANEAGANMVYILYDSGTDEAVSEGITDALGRFTLSGGQYAVFQLVDGATWTVSEAVDAKWTLSSLTAETDETITGWKADVIADNTAEVRTLAETVYAIAAETSYEEDVDAGTALDKDKFLVTAYSSDGTGRILQSNEFEISPETAQEATGEMEVVVTYEGAEDTVTVTVAAEVWNVSYAVAIYGIKADTYLDEEGQEQTAGLTFGPATGESYVNSYLAHVEEEAEGVVNSSNFRARTAEEATEEGVTYCIHWLTWAQIVEQCAKDPTVFQTCLEKGCTHSVHINLNSSLKNASYDYSGMKGDGGSSLYYSIQAQWRLWNNANTNVGGWPASRIRATLNGKDSYTKVSAGTDTLSTDTCLFSCFPRVLQENIVARAVRSNTVYYSKTETDVLTTYDKLWILSYMEVSYYTGDYNLKYEGSQYERITVYATTNTLRNTYTEDESIYNTWLRSLDPAYKKQVYFWLAKKPGSCYTSQRYGLAPAFCLP